MLECHPMDPQRRLFLRGRSTVNTAPPAPRPPWARTEREFITHCTRCDDCITACPEGILVKGDGGFPEVRFNETGCTSCARCVEACRPLALVRQANQPPWDWRATMGPSCLAQQKVECRVCGEICDSAAIRFVPTLGGIASPTLDMARCTGCGACVAPCPTHAIAMKAPSHD